MEKYTNCKMVDPSLYPGDILDVMNFSNGSGVVRMRGDGEDLWVPMRTGIDTLPQPEDQSQVARETALGLASMAAAGIGLYAGAREVLDTARTSTATFRDIFVIGTFSVIGWECGKKLVRDYLERKNRVTFRVVEPTDWDTEA